MFQFASPFLDEMDDFDYPEEHVELVSEIKEYSYGEDDEELDRDEIASITAGEPPLPPPGPLAPPAHDVVSPAMVVVEYVSETTVKRIAKPAAPKAPSPKVTPASNSQKTGPQLRKTAPVKPEAVKPEMNKAAVKSPARSATAVGKSVPRQPAPTKALAKVPAAKTVAAKAVTAKAVAPKKVAAKKLPPVATPQKSSKNVVKKAAPKPVSAKRPVKKAIAKKAAKAVRKK